MRMRDNALIAGVFSVFACGAGTATQSASIHVPTGVWGGKGIQLTVTATGAILDYGCDTGTVGERLSSDPSGKFVAHGTHVFGVGGPRQMGDVAPKPHRARYEGTRKGEVIQLTVSLPALERKLGEFTLQLSRRAALNDAGDTMTSRQRYRNVNLAV